MNEILIWGMLFLVAVILLIFRSLSEQKKIKKQVMEQLKEEYGSVPMKNRIREEAAAKGSYLHFIKNSRDFFLDDITWNDLDLELVFQRINYTRCSAGTEELYRMLRCPVMDEAVLKERNALADGIGEWASLREELSLELYTIGFTGKYALEDYLDYLENLGQRNNLKHILQDCLYIPVVGMLFLNPGVGVACLFLVLVINIMTYFKEKGEVNPYLVSFAYILRMLRGAEKIGNILEKKDNFHGADYFRKYRDILRRDIAGLESFRRFSGVAMSMRNPAGGSGPLDILFDYLKMALHLDLMKFNQMLRVVRERQEVIEEMVLAIGTLDACISIAYYRASLDGWCKPDFCGGYGIRTKELYHPLLKEPVKNSITAERGVLVTGSNASGKSTFLKTVALGAVFSQTICTVLAEYWSAPFYRVMSSMALRDNLTGGESYFMVELKALKRILDGCSSKNMEEAEKLPPEQAPVLCFVDEVLRGTNTVERIAASSRILKSLTGKQVLCFAATHDIELTYLLEKEYDNYHFEENIENGDISFNYLLRKGRAESRNAIRLLEVMGYDHKVTEEAEKLAEHFLASGEWVESY